MFIGFDLYISEAMLIEKISVFILVLEFYEFVLPGSLFRITVYNEKDAVGLQDTFDLTRGGIGFVPKIDDVKGRPCLKNDRYRIFLNFLRS